MARPCLRVVPAPLTAPLLDGIEDGGKRFVIHGESVAHRRSIAVDAAKLSSFVTNAFSGTSWPQPF